MRRCLLLQKLWHGDYDHCNIYLTEFLNTLCPGGMSPHELVVKLNSSVILLGSLDPSSGLCNGTRLIYREFMPNLIQCEISTGFSKGELVLLPRITLKAPDVAGYPFQFQRIQFQLNCVLPWQSINHRSNATTSRGVYSPTVLFPWPALCCTFKSKEIKQYLGIYCLVVEFAFTFWCLSIFLNPFSLLCCSCIVSQQQLF